MAPCGHRRRQTNLIQQRIVVANCWHAYEGNELLLSSVHLLIHLPSHLKLLLAFHDYQMPGFIIVKFGHALAASIIVSPWIQAFCRVCMGQHVWVEFTPELLNQQIFRFSATQKFRFISIYFYIPFVCVYTSISVYVLHLSTFPDVELASKDMWLLW